MKIQDIMTTAVDVVRPTDTITDAAKKMRNDDVGAVPVCSGRRLEGMLTDRDIAVRVVASGVDAVNALVRDFMTSDLVYCFEDDTVEDAERIMMERQIRRLPVVTHERHELAGIVSLGDLAAKTGQLQQVGRTLREISEPTHFA